MTGKNLCWSLFLIKLQFMFPVKYAKNLGTIFLKCSSEHLLPNFILKETPTQVFSCKFCELFKNTYFVEGLQTAGCETPTRGSLFNKVASMTTWRHWRVLEWDSTTGIFCKFCEIFRETFLQNTSSNHLSHDVLFFPFCR